MMDDFTKAYFEAALWSSVDDDGEPLDAHYGVEDIAPECREAMILDCAVFQGQTGQYSEQAGHDFWLTRNRHGAGFWDSDWPDPLSGELTDAAHAFGEFEVVICADS